MKPAEISLSKIIIGLFLFFQSGRFYRLCSGSPRLDLLWPGLTCRANSSVFSSRRFETLERNDQAAVAKVESFEEVFERTYSSVLCNARASLKLANLEEEKLVGVSSFVGCSIVDWKLKNNHWRMKLEISKVGETVTRLSPFHIGIRYLWQLNSSTSSKIFIYGKLREIFLNDKNYGSKISRKDIVTYMLIEMLQAITRFIFILEFITYIVRSVLVILQEKLACEFRVQESFIATKGVERPQTVHVRGLSRQWLLVNLLSRIAPSTF